MSASAEPAGRAGPDDSLQRLLIDVVALHEREDRAVVAALHDGPMQEITAILLELASIRRATGGPAADRLHDIENRLHDTVASLHRPPSPFRPGHDPRQILELALAQRVAGLLTDDLQTRWEIDEFPPDPGTIAVLITAVQLLLQANDPVRRADRLSVEVRSGPEDVELTLWVVPAEAGRNEEERAARLARTAEILGARLTVGPGAGHGPSGSRTTYGPSPSEMDDVPGTGWSASLRMPARRRAGHQQAGAGHTPDGR